MLNEPGNLLLHQPNDLQPRQGTLLLPSAARGRGTQQHSLGNLSLRGVTSVIFRSLTMRWGAVEMSLGVYFPHSTMDRRQGLSMKTVRYLTPREREIKR